jgi:hypothetical protein
LNSSTTPWSENRQHLRYLPSSTITEISLHEQAVNRDDKRMEVGRGQRCLEAEEEE